MEKIQNIQKNGFPNYQLIILDCNMPVMNGYETCKQLRLMMKQREINKMWIIAYTADASNENMQKCLEFQFDEVFLKPISLSKLRKLCEKFIAKSQENWSEIPINKQEFFNYLLQIVLNNLGQKFLSNFIYNSLRIKSY